MFDKVIHTFFSKLIVAVISFLLLIMNAQVLGASGLGTLGLIVLGITIIQLIANLFNGGIVYFTSRLNIGTLYLLAVLWSIFSVGCFMFFNEVIELFEAEYALHIYFLALLQALISIHLYVLVGHEKIKIFNTINVSQALLTIGLLSYFYFIREEENVMAFVKALYLVYVMVWLGSLFPVYRLLRKPKVSQMTVALKKVLYYGFFVQTANTFQLLNYRISYFFLDAYAGKAALGQYTAGIRLSEAMLIPGRSIATVQYARISAKNKDQYAQRITFLFMKISFMITLLGVFVILSLPPSVYTWLLSDDFSDVKTILWCMSIGLVFLSAEIILSHYFSGTGRQKMNSISALIGLVFTLIGCFVFIPEYGAIGAAITTAISYSSMFLFMFIIMNRQSGVSWQNFIPTKRDFEILQRIAKRNN